jgi:type IV secretory pathway TraG/TraD family ATPase VirD4
LLRQFLAAVADCAVVEGLNLSSCEGLPEAEHRRLFYILDELDSIGNISKLDDGFARGRKNGCSFVVGIQTLAQLRRVYGKEMATTILGNVATRAILRQEDGETALEMQKTLGEQDIERRTVSLSQTAGNSRPGLFAAGHSHNSTGKTASEQIQIVTRPCILASELQAMQRLHGVLMRGDKPHNPFKLEIVPMPVITPPFVEAVP